jgi:DNA-directed RNA polymerase alpha subunit
MSISQEFKIDDLPDELLEKASRIPLSALHLPSRAETALKKSGHKSSLDGIRFLSEDLKNLPGIREKTLKESEKEIYSFIKRLQQATPAELEFGGQYT